MSIRNRRAEELARELASLTGSTMTDVIVRALQDTLDRVERAPAAQTALAEIMEISRRCAALPILDRRTTEQILGYDRERA